MKALITLGWVVTSAAVLGVVGCSGSSSSTSGGGGTTTTPVTTTNPATTSRIFVIQNPTASNATGAILQFSATATGSQSPTGSIVAATGQSFNAVTTDASGNVYVATGTSSTGGSIEEFLAGSASSAGVATPQRALPVNSTTLISNVDGLAASSGGEIFVSEDSGAVLAFTATATGSVAPARNILGYTQTGGGLSTVILADAIASDTADNLYVVNEGAPTLMPIVIFNSSATGNVAPTRTIGGSATGLVVGQIGGIATDSSNNLYVTTNSGSGASRTGSILVFGPGVSGNVQPIRLITGSGTQLIGAYGIAVDSLGAMYVTTFSATGTPTVLTFPAGTTGNVSPTYSFTSPAWTNPDAQMTVAIH